MRKSLALCALATILLGVGVATAQQTDCVNKHCSYFPFIAKPYPAVTILSSTTYPLSGSRIFLGEVRNDTATNVKDVKITANLVDANGLSLLTAYGITSLDILKPGQRSPFEIIVENPPAHYDRYELRVGWNYTIFTPLQGLEADHVGDSAWGGRTGHVVFGEVHNQTGADADDLRVVFTGYDAQGTAVATGTGTLTRATLAAGESGWFVINIPMWNDATRYELQVQGKFSQVATPTPRPFGSIFENVSLSSVASNYTGSCPHIYEFPISITLKTAATITFLMEAGSNLEDYHFNLPAPTTAFFPNAGTQSGTFDLPLNASMSGWVQMHITHPEDVLSDKVVFNLTCQ